MNIDTRTQIIDALGKNSNARAVATQIGDVSHVSIWQIAKAERIELAAGKAIRGIPGISPRMRGRIIEALRGSNVSPRLIARRLGHVSHVTVWKISNELAAGKASEGILPRHARKCAVRGTSAPQALGRET
jgi:hypothetical protein